jgi:hypothetical protein
MGVSGKIIKECREGGFDSKTVKLKWGNILIHARVRGNLTAVIWKEK